MSDMFKKRQSLQAYSAVAAVLARHTAPQNPYTAPIQHAVAYTQRAVSSLHVAPLGSRPDC
jgi:hypothetical protein